MVTTGPTQYSMIPGTQFLKGIIYFSLGDYESRKFLFNPSLVQRKLLPNKPRAIKPSGFVSQVHWIKCRTESCSFTGMLVSPFAPLRMSELVQTRTGQNFASP